MNALDKRPNVVRNCRFLEQNISGGSEHFIRAKGTGKSLKQLAVNLKPIMGPLLMLQNQITSAQISFHVTLD